MGFKKGESGNPGGRPEGARNKRTILRNALEKAYDEGESGFWLALAEKAKKGDSNAISMIGARLIPPLKSVDMNINLDGLNEGTLTQKAEKIIEHMGGGEISPSEATAMITGLSGLCKVLETEQLSKRLEALERILKSR